MVGGKSKFGGEENIIANPEAQAGTLAQLHSALKSAFVTKRWFRDPMQWVEVWCTGYGPTAVACGHITLRILVQQLNVMLGLWAEVRVAGESHYIPFLYDELLWGSRSARAEQKDPEFDIAKASEKINKEILVIAKLKLQTTLHSVGVIQNGHKSAVDHGDGLAMGALHQQQAASEMSFKRSEEARKKLEVERKASEQCMASMAAASTQHPVQLRVSQFLWQGVARSHGCLVSTRRKQRSDPLVSSSNKRSRKEATGSMAQHLHRSREPSIDYQGQMRRRAFREGRRASRRCPAYWQASWLLKRWHIV